MAMLWAALAGIQLGIAPGIYVGWKSDNHVLRSRALAITAGLHTDAERIIAVSNWVYYNKGFVKHHGYFLLSRLGPTPIQVLEGGGDCADKSRLTAAMLNELGIRAGLLMIFPCAGCAPIHTVVEADYEKGRMVVDPVWNIFYPESDDRFLGVAELARTGRGPERLLELQREYGPDDAGSEKISAMPAAEATFDWTSAINWEKNWVTRAAAALIKAAGYDPDAIFRPRIVEDPKLAVSVLLFVGGIACAAFGWCALCLGTRRERSGGGVSPRQATRAQPRAIAAPASAADDGSQAPVRERIAA